MVFLYSDNDKLLLLFTIISTEIFWDGDIYDVEGFANNMPFVLIKNLKIKPLSEELEEELYAG